jgi:amino acid transporter
VRADINNAVPLFKKSSGVVNVLIMGPALYLGFSVIPQVAEEINLPKKLTGKFLVMSIFLAALWYIAIIIGLVLSAPSNFRQTSTIPVADAMAYLFNTSIAGRIMILGGIAGILTSWNAFVVAACRVIYVMARKKILPPIFGRISPVYGTPSYAILLVLIITVLAPFLGENALIWLMIISQKLTI